MNAGQLQITHEDRLRNIVRAFKVAQSDENAKIPTYLSLLIDAARQALEQSENSYAEAMIRADQLGRQDSRRSDLESTTDGRTLRPGR